MAENFYLKCVDPRKANMFSFLNYSEVTNKPGEEPSYNLDTGKKINLKAVLIF